MLLGPVVWATSHPEQVRHPNRSARAPVSPRVANGIGTRLGGLVEHALARHVEQADGAPVLVVEKGSGRRRVLRGRSAQPSELHRLVRLLDARTAPVKRWGAVVWRADVADAPTNSHPVRYAYCVTPDHRQGVLLAQHYAEAEPVGDPEPVDRRDLPSQWRPAALTPGRSPMARARADPRAPFAVASGAFLLGMFLANVLIWVADGLGGTSAVGATVVSKGYDPSNRGSKYELDIVSDGGGRVELDSGDLGTVWGEVAVGDRIDVLSSGFTGRTVAVRTTHSSLHLAGGFGQPVAWLLLDLFIGWLLAKLFTWPRLRWWLVRAGPLGIAFGVWASL